MRRILPRGGGQGKGGIPPSSFKLPDPIGDSAARLAGLRGVLPTTETDSDASPDFIGEAQSKSGEPHDFIDEAQLKSGESSDFVDEAQSKSGEPSDFVDEAQLKSGEPSDFIDEAQLKSGEPPKRPAGRGWASG